MCIRDSVYTADKAAADALDADDVVTDQFTYTISDGNGGTATSTLTFTVKGIDDDPVGVADTGAVDEDAQLQVNAGSGVLSNDTDADASSSLSVTTVSSNNTSQSGSAGSEITGQYGKLTLDSDGKYTYTANTAAADNLAHNATATDVFLSLIHI